MLTNAWQTVAILVVVLALGIFMGMQLASPSCPTNQSESVPALQQG